MRAAVLRNKRFEVDEFPDPRPAEGQVLIAVKACGICGSDLHFAHHGAEITQLRSTMERMGERPTVDFDADVFMGHEFSGEIIEAGPDTPSPAPGTLVTSMPLLRTPRGVAPIVVSNTIHGGYGEQMLLSARYVMPVPKGLSAEHAALTEPMTVGLHAVNRSAIRPGDSAVVIGAGPVGQSVIAALVLRGIEPIIAADYSPARRALASVMGAHQTVDPSVEPVFDAWDRLGVPSPPVVFMAVAVEGLVNETMRSAPRRSRLAIIGACSGLDPAIPQYGLTKELTIEYAFGFDRHEFAETLSAIAEGHIDVSPLITGRTPLDGIEQAVHDLANPERHCKILVTPRRRSCDPRWSRPSSRHRAPRPS